MTLTRKNRSMFKILLRAFASPSWLLMALIFWASLAPAEIVKDQLISASAQLTLNDVVDSALIRSPDYAVANAHADVANAYQARSQRWLPEVPSLSLAYETDQHDADAGFRESQIGLTLPVWKRRQQDAFEKLAHRSGEFAKRFPDAARLGVSAQVRNSLWALKETEEDVNLARDALDVAQRLEMKVKRQVELGNVPRTDLIAARRERLAQQTQLLEAQASWQGQQKHYQHLTGLTEFPAEISESTQLASSAEHPALAISRLMLEQAEAELEVCRRSGNGQPELTVAGRKERADRFSDSEQYLSMELSVPFGGQGYNTVALAEARQKVATLRSDHRRLEISLEAALEEAQILHESLQQQLDMSSELLSLAEQKYALDQRAYGAGVMSLLELLRSQKTLLDSKRDHQRLQIQIGRTQADINQLSGVSL